MQAQYPWAARGRSSWAHAGLWGLARVVRLEETEVQLVCLDLEEGTREAIAQGLKRCAASVTSSEAEFVWRSGQMCVPRLTDWKAPSGSPSPSFASSPCVMTGAFGGVGLIVARWLLDSGEECLLMLSRSGRPVDKLGSRYHVSLSELS